MGRSLPRAIAAAKAAGTASRSRAPPFEMRTEGVGSDDPYKAGSRTGSNGVATLPKRTEEKGRGGVTIEDTIAGNPRRAMEELSLRAKLEVVRGEVDATLKMHATMARGERTSWLKQIEGQNEENAYQVCAG